MAERPAADGDRPGRASAPETAALLQDAAAALEADAAGAPGTALLPWPDRVRASASQLCLASLRIQATLADGDRFAQLTDPSLATAQAGAIVRDFTALVDTALAALIDLTGYDNPDQDYPDLTAWFEFRCANVVYGRQTDTLPTQGFRAEGPPRP